MHRDSISIVCSSAMSRDKKNRLGKIRFVLPRSIGSVELTDAAAEDDVRAVLRRFERRESLRPRQPVLEVDVLLPKPTSTTTAAT